MQEAIIPFANQLAKYGHLNTVPTRAALKEGFLGSGNFILNFMKFFIRFFEISYIELVFGQILSLFVI